MDSQEKKSLKNIIYSNINKLLILTFNKKIIAHRSIKNNRIAKQIFKNRILKYDNGGYYYISPMPTKEDLELYYTTTYWNTRNNINSVQIINQRDLVHFQLFKQFIPQYLNIKINFLNFGSGHGGLSHLMWSLGMKVNNIDPAQSSSNYQERWQKFKQIEKVPNKSIDIVYGSHSLEHVQDISKFKNEIERVLKPNGILFWEVPNADCNSNGAMLNKIDIPHTYYFQKKFFKNWFNETILCESFDKNYYKIDDFLSFKNKQGKVIIAIGKI